MESINPNLSTLVQMSQLSSSISFSPAFNNHVNNSIVNDSAFSFVPGSMDNVSKFDLTMSNFAAFKDLITVAQDGISEMKAQGESIRELVAQAQQEGVTPELMDKIQAEVDARVAEINRIRNGSTYNEINPFDGKFSLNIPDWQSYIGAAGKDEASSEMSNIMASFDIDINIEGDGFSFGGSAKIDIGYNEDGALQITVDASMDYDLSGLVGKGGVTSDGAFDMINNFINMLGVQQGDLGNAQNFLDAIFEQIFNAAYGSTPELPDGVEIETDSSEFLKGKMVQQATITLDEVVGLAPNIAINIL